MNTLAFGPVLLVAATQSKSESDRVVSVTAVAAIVPLVNAGGGGC